MVNNSNYSNSWDKALPAQVLGTLEEVILEEGITRIGNYSFYGTLSSTQQGKLTTVTLPSTLESIGTSAFAGQKNMTLTIPAGLKELGESCFSGCGSSIFNGLSEGFPQGMESIPAYAFYGCTSFTDLVISENIKSIGASAFYSCSNISSLTIAADL